jgi:hypothetical protein
MLAARRLAERGVRFIQVFHGDGAAGAWDAHAGLRANHSSLCAQVDKPIAGLLIDLKRRGPLEDTVVVWATEFGRTPCAQGADGRDHHNYGFSIWMAGGGIQGGIVRGATDSLGFHAAENRHYIWISTRLSFTYSGSILTDSRSPAASDWRSNTANRSVRFSPPASEGSRERRAGDRYGGLDLACSTASSARGLVAKK